jgi:hypothetical protein
VLLLGESGVGKGACGAHDHRNSRAPVKRFVQVNCAAIPEELIESELSATRKGSFTGATEKQVGKFEQGRSRHDLPRRSWRHEPEDAGEGAAGACRSRSVERPWLGADDQGGRRVIAATNKNSRRRSIAESSARISTSAQRDPDRRAAAARAARGHSALVQHFAKRTAEEHNLKPKRSIRRRLERCSATAGAATSASCATPSSG